MKVKGVLLCGGEGTRLRPMTESINKHLIRVHDLPMAEYPLRKMIEAGVRDVLIVSGGENFAAVIKYFGSGRKWNIRINYAIQDAAGGIAQALSLAEEFIGNDKALVCLGDNLWSMDIGMDVNIFTTREIGHATLFIIESKTPERFGVLEMNKANHPVDILEKPLNPPSNLIVAGIYLYGPEVFEMIRTLRPSGRGELEITDINRMYLKAGKARVVKMSGWWSDCGTIETLLQAEELIKNDRPISSLRS